MLEMGIQVFLCELYTERSLVADRFYYFTVSVVRSIGYTQKY